MYEFFKGILVQIQPAYLVLDVQGVGYVLHVANPYRLSDQVGKEVTLYAYQHVSQDSVLLYGFLTSEEKQLFLRLIKVSGIGPKSALAILANGDHSGLIQAIESENHKYLMQFPGVGKKTAGQLILDLKGKLNELITHSPDRSESSQATTGHNEALDEAIQALDALGYSKRECDKAYQELKDQDLSTDAYLRQALSLLTSY